MPEKQRIKVPPDNYGRVYVGLLLTTLSAHAKLCYGVMWSFGSADSWASVPSIAARMSVSENTVRKAQTELQDAGWIVLVDEKRGGTKNWELIVPAANPSGREGAPLQEMNPTPSNGEGGPLQGVNPNKELKQELKQESPADAGASALIKTFCEEYATLKGGTYKVSGKDAGQAKLVKGYAEAWFRPACRAYLITKDRWVQDAGFTLSAMLSQLNKWAVQGNSEGARHARAACQHRETEVVERNGKAEAHKCKSCGLVTWK